MNDVNLNSPGLKLVSSSEQVPSRASASAQVEGTGSASTQIAISPSAPEAQIQTAESFRELTQVSNAQSLEKRTETQREQLDDAVSKLNDFVQNVQRDLQFEVNNELGQTVVRVVDQETQKVIRQIPDEVALRLAENLQQDEPLTLFNLKV
ncbi:flagellar protein FlaG [Marinobacter salicampi]|uniref:flagellar protein FlaG n=1 Tax=Marinobacter salicampi TaxID=435907 RepID=UPI00140A1AF6|nr:flagellar protein FlaG [Marinobacter salicampi]